MAFLPFLGHILCSAVSNGPFSLPLSFIPGVIREDKESHFQNTDCIMSLHPNLGNIYQNYLICRGDSLFIKYLQCICGD